MSSHPFFSIVRAKVSQAAKAVEHMQDNDLQQKSLFVTHPEHYQRSVHAESMAVNIQGIYAQIEDILSSLAKTIDGVSPTGESPGQDLLLQVSMAAENRVEIIQQGTLLGLSKLRLFRAVTLKSCAEDLSAENVFDHVNLMGAIALQVFKDVEVFIRSFEKFGDVSRNNWYDMTQISAIAERIKIGLGEGTRVFLFGSYAWGQPNEDSDLDFAVVVPDHIYHTKTAVTARKLSCAGLIPIDVMAYPSTLFNTSISGTMSFEIRAKGLEL